MSQEEIDFFDNIADKWDEMEIKSIPSKINYILDRCDVQEGQKILDLGTGTGVLIPYLLKRVTEKGKVVGIDASAGMLEQAKKKFSGLTRYKLFFQLDFEKNEVKGVYDRIFLYCVFPHLNEPIKTLKKLIYHNLNENGKLFIAFPNDEVFVNSIHEEKNVESNKLPPAKELVRILNENDLNASILEADRDVYLIKISK